MKIALVLAVVALAPAFASAAPADACFRTRDIAAHRKVDNQTLHMRVGLKDVFRVTTKGACLAGAMQSDTLVTGAPPSGIVCTPVEFDLGVKHGAHVSKCIVDSIVKLAPQEAAALPKDVRP